MTLQNDFHAMVEYASKAPSGHNTQPWFFTLGADAITITPDFSKRLPVVDPDDRELFISLGCAAENLRFTLNANNLFDQKYKTIPDALSFGAPRHVMATFRYEF